MPIDQDRCRQKSHKSYEPNLQLKRDLSKELYSDPQSVWQVTSCDVDFSSSESETDDEEIESLPSSIPREVQEESFIEQKPKSRTKVRFEGHPYVEYPWGDSTAERYSDVECEKILCVPGSRKRSSHSEARGTDFAIERRRGLSDDSEAGRRREKKDERFRLPHRVIDKIDVPNFDESLPAGRCKELRDRRHEKSRSVECDDQFSRRRPNYDSFDYKRMEKRSAEEKFMQLTAQYLKDLELQNLKEKRHWNHGHEYLLTRNRPKSPSTVEDHAGRRSRHKYYDCERLKRTEYVDEDKGSPCHSVQGSKSYKRLSRTTNEIVSLEAQTASNIYKKLLASKEDSRSRRSHDPLQVYHATVHHRPCSKQEYHQEPKERDRRMPVNTGKKKLESVDEHHEECSDTTYKVTCPKVFGSEPPSKIDDRSMDGNTSHRGGEWNQQPRICKARSKRTKRKKSWQNMSVLHVKKVIGLNKKAIVIMGPDGPVVYTTLSGKHIPFRKTRSSPEGQMKSYKTPMNPDSKVFLSSSEPGQRICSDNNDLIFPEEDVTVDEKMVMYSENINEIVKNSQEKFYKSLSNQEFPQCSLSGRSNDSNFLKAVGDENQQGDGQNVKTMQELKEMKYPPFDLRLPPRVPKPFKEIGKSDHPVEFKECIGHTLNEQPQKCKKMQEEENTHETSCKSKNGEKSAKTREIKAEDVTHKEERAETRKERLQEERLNRIDEKEKGKDEESQTASVKSNEQITQNKQRSKKYFESTTSNNYCNRNEYDVSGGDAPPMKEQERSERENSDTGSDMSKVEMDSPGKSKDGHESNPDMLAQVFQNLAEKGCAISKKESENLYESLRDSIEHPSEEVTSSTLSEEPKNGRNEFSKAASPEEKESRLREREERLSKELTKTQASLLKLGRRHGPGRKCKQRSYKEGKVKTDWTDRFCERLLRRNSDDVNNLDCYRNEVMNKKVSKLREFKEESKRQPKRFRDGKSKRKLSFEDKMKFLRDASPSIAAQSESGEVHLKQLKKYIEDYIDMIKQKNSSSSEARSKPDTAKPSSSMEGSEVKVDVQKLLDIFNPPFKKIASDMTLNIAKKLTDALVQENVSKKGIKNRSCSTDETKSRRNSEDESDEVASFPRGTTSGSGTADTAEPAYMKQMKKMRNDHLQNIVQEVSRLSELLRFIDKCDRVNLEARRRL